MTYSFFWYPNGAAYLPSGDTTRRLLERVFRLISELLFQSIKEIDHIANGFKLGEFLVRNGDAVIIFQTH